MILILTETVISHCTTNGYKALSVEYLKEFSQITLDSKTKNDMF